MQDVYPSDILFVSNEHIVVIERDGIYGVPDLVIEILSPLTAGYDRGTNTEAYQKFGVKEYWIVDPKEQIMEYFVNSADGFQIASTDKQSNVCSSALSGFCVDVQAVFNR